VEGKKKIYKCFNVSCSPIPNANVPEIKYKLDLLTPVRKHLGGKEKVEPPPMLAVTRTPNLPTTGNFFFFRRGLIVL
jgi:hypothetical protein